MAITSFMPKVWSARLQENLHSALVFGALCNRHYEGDIAQWGDTVHINALADITVKPYTPHQDIDDPQQLSGTDTTLVIDHGAYYNFYINDVDAAQSRADLMDAAMRNAAWKLAEDTEKYILGVIRAGAGTTKEGALPAEGMYGLLVSIKTALDSKNVPRANRKLIVPPTVEAQLLLDNRFVTGSGAISDARLAEGSIARAAGFDIYISNDLTNEIIAMTPDAVTFAQQITKMDAYRREKGFDDGIKGLSLCGAKVILPSCVYIHKLTE
ncbi:MAG: P22 phage major capsid protein family protein [Aristaeellaceae bacterium]